MATQKKSVDEIWRELNARPAGRSGTLGTVLGGSSNLPGISTQSRTLPAKSSEPHATGTAAAAPSHAAKDVVGASDLRRPTLHYDPAKAGVTSEALQAFVTSIQRTINCMSDPDRSSRKQAITTLTARLTKGGSSAPAPEPSMLQALICGPLLYPVTTLLSDPGEAARLAAAELLQHAATSVPDFSAALPVVMPELVKRMGHLPVVEPAEEVRLLLTGLVTAIVQRSSCSTIQQYVGDICLFLFRAFEDGFHDIKKTACTATCLLAASAPPGSIEPNAEKLLQAIVPNLQHQHSRVRLAVMEALGALVSHGCVPAGLIQSTIAPVLRPVAYDRTPAVREALVTAVAQWLGYRNSQQAAAVAAGSGAERVTGAAGAAPSAAGQQQGFTGLLASPETVACLLPLLLLGVSDAQPSLAELSLSLVEGVGEVWDQHTAAGFGAGQGSGSIASAAAAGPDASGAGAGQAASPGPQPMQGVEGAAADATEACQAAATISDSGAENAVLACQLGPPFRSRPAVGARHQAQALLPLLLPPLLRDLAEWTVSLRACAARQLRTLLVLAEAGVTEQLARLMPALCSAIGDEDRDVASNIIACVHVLGAHVQVQRWLPLMLDQVSNARLSLIQKANTLVVLSGLLHTAAKAQADAAATLPSPLLSALTSALTNDEMRASEHPAIRQQLLAVCINIVRWLGPRSSEVVQQLYTLLLQVYGFERDPTQLQRIREAMAQLAAACGRTDFEELADAHGPAVLEAACAHTSSWSAEAPGYLVFRALLLTTGPHTLTRLLPRLCEALGPLLADHEADPALRLGALQLLDQILEDSHRCTSLGGDAALAVLSQLLLPPLVWRAGKTAAAVRFAAITALATMLRRQLVPGEALLVLVTSGALLPLLNQSLDEDWYTDLRNTACFVVQQLLLLTGAQLDAESRRLIYPELLKRLDDSSNQVRISACGALQAFCTTMAPSYCSTNSGYLAAGVVIHMDDSNTEVQEAACRVLEALAAVKPQVVAAEVAKVQDRFRSKHYCERVQQACAAAAVAGG